MSRTSKNTGSLPGPTDGQGSAGRPLQLADVRAMAMALRATTESPHHHYTSFRVRGRIYATAPVTGGSLHVFVDEADRDGMVKFDPATYKILGWGRKAVGLRVDLGSAKAEDVGALLRIAWQRKLSGQP